LYFHSRPAPAFFFFNLHAQDVVPSSSSLIFTPSSPAFFFFTQSDTSSPSNPLHTHDSTSTHVFFFGLTRF